MGSNIPVANVQELATSCCYESSKIPERYMRPEAEAEPVCSMVDDDVDLPVIDLGRLLDPQLCQEESVKLNHACENWGFFQLIKHGISEEVISNMKADISEFFKLPLEQKQAYAIGADGPEGYGQHFVVSEEQKLDWADLMYLVTQPPVSRNMAFWPAYPPNFRDSLDKYSLAIKGVASGLLGWMGRNLGIDPEIFQSKFMDQQSVRMNYYPPCLKADKVLGLSPHTDGGLLTLLLQVSDIEGLQIKKGCKWFPIKVLPDAIIVNVGDALEIMSNGKYRSIEHRAVVNIEKERLSIATFHFPTGNCMVGPLPEVVKGEYKKYKSMTMDDYLKNYFAAKLDGRNFLDSLKLEE